MAELTEQAGLPRPEFEEMAGVLVVRFRPSRYLPPQRIGHNLTRRQQDVLQLLGTGAGLALSEIHRLLGGAASIRSLRDDLKLLRSLELVDSSGRGRGARWFLKGRNMR
jgi:ATP-dependent DNA helicase RecG